MGGFTPCCPLLPYAHRGCVAQKRQTLWNQRTVFARAAPPCAGNYTLNYLEAALILALFLSLGSNSATNRPTRFFRLKFL